MARIPPRQSTVQDKDRRFYVCAPSSVYLELQQESYRRGTDLWTLGGAVLQAWLAAGCPDFGFASEPSDLSDSPEPPPSSSPIADDQGGEA